VTKKAGHMEWPAWREGVIDVGFTPVIAKGDLSGSGYEHHGLALGVDLPAGLRRARRRLSSQGRQVHLPLFEKPPRRSVKAWIVLFPDDAYEGHAS
jgi:hypothetical protein